MNRFYVLLVLLFFPSVGFSQIEGKVVGVSDGDTFTLLTTSHESIKIRLHGIDCPEKSQAYGQVAKKVLSDLIFEKNVSVVKKDIDRYGRTIAIVTVGGLNVNEKLLESGLAWHYKYYDKNEKWAMLETQAREKKVGLWQDGHQTAPWEFRKQKVVAGSQ